MGAKGRILVVVWTLRGENQRLISAWKADRPQRQRYERQFRSWVRPLCRPGLRRRQAGGRDPRARQATSRARRQVAHHHQHQRW